MGSLTDLNTYAEDLIEATDERNPGPKLWPSYPLSQDQTEYSGTFAITRVVEIEEIVRPSDADLRFQVDVSAVPGASVVWPVVPVGCTVVNPTTGVYYIDGVDTILIWDQIKDPNIVLPNGFYGDFEYVVSWVWNGITGNEFEEYTVGAFVPVANVVSNFNLTCQFTRIKRVTANLTGIFSNPNPILDDKVYFAENKLTQFYAKGTTVSLVAPTIASQVSATYEITATPSNTALVQTISLSSNPGVGFTFNNSTKVATLSGSRTAMIAALANLQIQFAAGAITDFQIQYQGTSNQPLLITANSIVCNMLSTEYLGSYSDDPYYLTATLNPVINYPTITNNSVDPNGDLQFSYTLVIEPNVINKINLIDVTDRQAFVFNNSQTSSASGVIGAIDNAQTVFAIASGDSLRIYDSSNSLSAPTLVTTLTQSGSSDDKSGSQFGARIQINDNLDKMFVSAPRFGEVIAGVSQARGAIYYYEKSGGVWSEVSRWEGDLSPIEQTFGNSFQINSTGNLIAVAINAQDSGLNTASGSVRIYSISGGSLTLLGTITDPSGGTNTRFGVRISCTDSLDKLAISDDLTGSTYIYSLSTGPYSASLTTTIADSSDDLTFVNSSGTKIFSGNKVYNSSGVLEFTFPAEPTGISKNGNYLTSNGYIYEYTTSWSARDYISLTSSAPVWISNAGDKLLISQTGNQRFYVYQNTGKTWDAGLKRLTLVGSKTQINNQLATLYTNINTNDPYDIKLIYTLTTPTPITFSRTQDLYAVSELIQLAASSSISAIIGTREFGQSSINAVASVSFNGGKRTSYSAALSSNASLVCNGDAVYPFIQNHNLNRRFGNGAPPGNYFITVGSSDATGNNLKPRLNGTLSGRYFNTRVTISGVSSDRIYIDDFANRSTTIWLSEASALSVAYSATNYNTKIEAIQLYETAGSTAQRSLRFEVFEFDYTNPNANGDSGRLIYDVTVTLSYVASF